MNEMVTIVHDYSAPMVQKMIERAKKSNERNRKGKVDCRQKREFQQPRFKSRCYAGREEYVAT